MIVSIFGKIGGGKTYSAVAHWLLPELLWGQRVIVTNVALDLPEIAAYLQKYHPDEGPIDLHDRIRIITTDEMGEFFAHREHGCDLPIPSEAEWRLGRNVNYDDCKRSVFYILDEVHVKFDARGWATQGPHATFYNSQHRKLDDECLFISQFEELVDKRFKCFSQEFVYVENLSIQRFFTFFRAPAYFVQKSYLRIRRDNDRPQWTKRFRFDGRIAKLYDTSAGVGIRGRKKAETRRKKGVHWSWFAAAGLAVVLVAAFVLEWVPRTVVGRVMGTATAAADPESERIAYVDPSPVYVNPAASVSHTSAALPPILDAPAPASPLTVSGIVRRGERFNVHLSDGRVIDERMGVVDTVSDNHVVLADGTVLWVRAASRPNVYPRTVPPGPGGPGRLVPGSPRVETVLVDELPENRVSTDGTFDRPFVPSFTPTFRFP